MKRRPLIVVLAALLVFATLERSLAEGPELNRRILEFAKENLGKKMGDGQCTGLILEAFKANDCRKFPNASDPLYKDEYVWGKSSATVVASEGKLTWEGTPEPGDVLQIRNAKFKGKVKGGTYAASAPHHTAVMVSLDNGVMMVYEQNVNGKQVVMLNKYVVSDMQEGKISFYRAVSK